MDICYKLKLDRSPRLTSLESQESEVGIREDVLLELLTLSPNGSNTFQCKDWSNVRSEAGSGVGITVGSKAELKEWITMKRID